MSSLRAEVHEVLQPIPIDTGGGCSEEKALVLAWLIEQFGLSLSLDIGVYRGRSLLPQAVAFRRLGRGLAYGVDPYSRTAAQQLDAGPAGRQIVEEFIAHTDYEALHREMEARIVNTGLEGQCRLIRLPSAEAAERFRRERMMFGLVHIDGNHDGTSVARDLANYVPLLAQGGFLVMDDVSWEAIQPEVSRMASQFPLLLQRHDAMNDYAVFQKSRHLNPLLRWRLGRLIRPLR